MALGYLGRSKSGHRVSVVYCDQCARERIHPMLHSTVYRVKHTSISLCEFHMILNGFRQPTPDFLKALEKARHDVTGGKDTATPAEHVFAGVASVPRNEEQRAVDPDNDHNQVRSVESSQCQS